MSDGLCAHVKIDPRDVWKTLVKWTITWKGPVIKKGPTLGKVMTELIEDDEIGDLSMVTLKKQNYQQT